MMPPYALLLCAIASVLGTLVATPLDADLRCVVALAAASLAAFAVFARQMSPSLALLVLGVFAGAALNAARQHHALPVVEERRTARYGATLLERSPESDGSLRLTLALDGGLRVLAQVRTVAATPGTRLIVRGRLEPFDLPRNPGEPSERDLERERGLDARLASAQILSTGALPRWDAATELARLHEWAHAQLRARLDEPAASVVAGELWGERSALPPELRSEFQETGTVHVLVTAGLHLGAVAALALAALTLLTLPRWCACVVASALVWCFVMWSGAQLPAVRAATMVTVALAARACGRATLSWNALAVAAIALAFSRPESVATPSFALSFSCVAAIFACAQPIERWIEERIALPDRVREAFVLSIATQIGVWPLGAATFLQFTPYAVAANVAIVPCVGATMALAALQLAAAWCAPLAQAFANANSWLLTWMLSVVRIVSALPAASIPMTPPPAWCVAAYDAAVLSAPLLWRRGAPTLALAAIVLALSWVLLPPRAFDPRLRITVLDVGQADGIVVQTPRGHTILVDAGGRLERNVTTGGSDAEAVGERTVVPYLLRHGVHALDAVVLSHPHGDHAGGVAPVLRRLHVTEFADGGQRYGGHAYQDALATAHGEGVPVLYPRAGAEWHTDDGVVLHFLGPSLPFIGGSRNDINENSVAFTLRYRGFCVLFTGDAGAAAEQRFLAEGVDLRCAVLKVGHHGSSYSSTPAFVEAVHPSYAVISVGRHNLFGHPARSTLETLQRIGASIYRTDEDGAVTILSDGERIEVSTMVER
jgi:competence protein ComEC